MMQVDERMGGVEIEEAQRRFNAAMARYNGAGGYRWFGYGVASANVALQLWLVLNLRGVGLSAAGWLAAVVAAWLLTDFVNGIVHMVMDAQDGYDSLVGPLIANFHLHHRTPVYTPRSLPVVYFLETGSKTWLVPTLAIVALLARAGLLTGWPLAVLVIFGVLSSVAEVSHYLCHTSPSRVAKFLGDWGILLSKRHHAVHHTQDNVSYAFLNGLTDPILNPIAKRFSPGYKNHTDLHYGAYVAEGESR